MIEINLLPGARKGKRGKGPALDTSAMMAGISSQFKDPFLIVAIVGLVLGLGLTGYMYMSLSGRKSAANERVQVALKDSTTYAGVIADRIAAAASRDSIVRQFAMIKALDGERYTWSHMLAELSAALPAYTWLTKVQQISPVVSIAAPPPPAPDTSAAAKAKAAKVKTKTVDEIAEAAMSAVTPLKLRVVGQTVDIMAMTRFMRTLEASPFIQNVTFIGSDAKPGDGAGMSEFTIEMTFQTPPPSAIRTVPLSVAVR